MCFLVSWPTWCLDDPQSRGWRSWIAVFILLYLPFCSIIRRHQRQLRARGYAPLGRRMTLEEAYNIKCQIAEHEFPTVFAAAMKFVFFKAEGIPSIAKLIARAAQRSEPRSAPPKLGHVTTRVTPADLVGRPGGPERAAAIDRVNRIHSRYRPSGKMSDEDLLYVLGLFALEAGRWVERFEWRPLAPDERRALATLWMALGDELRIPLDPLPSGRRGFRDALHWLAELEAWGREYERMNRRASPESAALAARQMEAWLRGVPACLRPIARRAVAALIEPELRGGMGIEAPSRIYIFSAELIVGIRKFFRAHLCSPVALVRGYKRE
ncbi:hypothetical protein F4802DRAFT_590779 [Xylaria palmicola]|nr:hypothetical protein F4802DRAFT_590779 [Xylaria palmicola]